MQQVEDLVNQSRDICRVADDQLSAQQHELDALTREKNQLIDNLSILENKYRDTMYLNDGAKDRLGGMHRMHVKLLATRQLEETLQKAFDRSKKSSIDQMLWVTRGYVSQFGAVYRLRCLMLHRNQRQAKNALARWFKLACDPPMLMKQNKEIPEFFSKFHTDRLVFNRDFEQWMLGQGL